MCCLMLRFGGRIWTIFEEGPSVFHTEKYNILRQCNVNATMADHQILRGQIRSRKMHEREGVVLPQCMAPLAT